MAIKAVELIVSGEVHYTGYREHLAKLGNKLKLVGVVENLEDGTVKILCKGEAEGIDKFKELVELNNKPTFGFLVRLIKVENITEIPLEAEKVAESCFKVRYGKLNAEIALHTYTLVNDMMTDTKPIFDVASQGLKFQARRMA